ncbi:MAG: hypothetical protein ACHQQ3_03275 [Gemmatimonadales bacterium]
MFSSCLFCHSDLGANECLPEFPVGSRLAFDAKRGRLWVVCTGCGRWNLAPLEERWETIDRCEKLFRDTWLRFSIENIGLARTRSGVELVRIGPALLPEIASWRYGARLQRWSHDSGSRRGIVRRSSRWLARQVAGAMVRGASVAGLSDRTVLRVSTFHRGEAVLARSLDENQRRVVIRYSHLEAAELIRPERDRPWRVRVAHDEGAATLAEGAGLRAAGTMLAALNFGAASRAEVRYAIAKLGDAGDPDGFFTRIATLTMRTSWGRYPDAPDDGAAEPSGRSVAERLALRLANRSFWGRGSTGSEPQTPLYRLPSVDRLALEMASNEDVERRALSGELEELREAWREAEEIAAIADDMFAGDALEEFKRQYYLRLRTES